MPKDSGNGPRNVVIAVAVIIILILLFNLGNGGGGGGTSTITTTQNGSTITITTTLSSSASSSSSFSGTCSNVFNPSYQMSFGGSITPTHGVSTQFSVVAQQIGKGGVANLNVNIQVFPYAGGSAIFNQNFVTSSQSFNYGAFSWFMTFPNSGLFKILALWNDPMGSACQVVQTIQVL